MDEKQEFGVIILWLWFFVNIMCVLFVDITMFDGVKTSWMYLSVAFISFLMGYDD